MKNNIVCIYHVADLDGKCGAAIVRKKFPNCKLIPHDYNWEFPFSLINENDTVYMVDISLTVHDMLKLKKNVKKFYWIDHHKSAIEKIKNYNTNIVNNVTFDGIRDINRSGCELTWKFLFNDYPIPLAVSLLGRYDVWDHSDSRCVPFQYGMRAEDNDPDDSIWDKVLGDNFTLRLDTLNEVIKNGRIIYKYEIKQNKLYMKNSFVTKLWGYYVLAINKANANSQLFDSVYDPNKHDIMMPYYITSTGELKFSLYTTKDNIDVSIIAGYYGGGGHKQAAGFHVNLNNFYLSDVIDNRI